MKFISRKNYREIIKLIDVSKLDEKVQKAKGYFDKITDEGTRWDEVDSDKNNQELVELYFESLNRVFLDLSDELIRKTKTSRNVSRQIPKYVKRVEKRSLELTFINRYLNLHGKAKTKRQIRLFINALQRAIIEKKIRKNSPYVKEIKALQKDLILLFSNYEKEEIAVVRISDRKRNRFKKVLGKEAEIPSVKIILEYVKLQGRPVPRESAQKLYKKIKRKLENGSIHKRDKYIKQINEILNDLSSLIDDNFVGGELRISSKTLNGIGNILPPNFESNRESGLAIPDDLIMNSLDIVDLKFEKLGFTGKWLDFIGDPSKGFSAMIFAKPKMGKSNLCLQLAGYLARNHGRVLYVAKEEKIGSTLQDKIIAMGIAHRNLDGVGQLPNDLSDYDFVFLDSITKLGLSTDDLTVLEQKYPNISFLSIFQVTKDGVFRGNNGFQHEVDVVIEIPEVGKAVQYGRFNQGGELDIFNEVQ